MRIALPEEDRYEELRGSGDATAVSVHPRVGESRTSRQALTTLLAVLFCLFGNGLIEHFAAVAPIREGDGFEYFYMLQAWHNHGTPDLRAVDIRSAVPVLQSNFIYYPERDAGEGFFLAGTGERFCWHFWLYSLFALPAKVLLHRTRGNEFAAFQITDACLFLLAIGVGLFYGRTALARRLTFLGLAAISPVLGYLRWPHPEVFTWAFVVISLTLLENRRYGGAAVAASVAATQNPPVLFLAVYVVVLSLRAQDTRQVLRAAGGALLSFLPNLFYRCYFGVPSLIAARGFSDTHLISVGRAVSLFTDLNQGMLPFVPLLLLLAGVALVRAGASRNWAGIGMGVVLMSMVLASETTANWNSGCAGMMRYAVWMVPLLAWLVAWHLPRTRSVARLVLAAIALQGIVVARYQGGYGYVRVSPLAAFVLSHAPALYSPEPEIFCERQAHRERRDYRELLPVGFVREDGVVTKLLVDAVSLPLLPERYAMPREYLRELERQLQGSEGPVYVTPPTGTVIAVGQKFARGSRPARR